MLAGRDVAGRLPGVAAALLGAVLDDPFVLARRLDALAAFEHVVAARLLDVHVLARLAGPDRDQRMPVVAGGHRDRVQVLVLQRLADVLEALGLRAALVLDLLDAVGEQAAVRIDQVRDLDAGDLQELADVVAAAAADAGHAEADRVVGPQHVARRLRAGDGERGRHAGGRRLTKELRRDGRVMISFSWKRGQDSFFGLPRGRRVLSKFNRGTAAGPRLVSEGTTAPEAIPQGVQLGLGLRLVDPGSASRGNAGSVGWVSQRGRAEDLWPRAQAEPQRHSSARSANPARTGFRST